MVVQEANQGVHGVLVQLVLRVSSAHRVGLEVDNLFQNLTSWLDSVTRKAYDVFLQGIGHNLELLNLVAAFSPVTDLSLEIIEGVLEHVLSFRSRREVVGPGHLSANEENAAQCVQNLKQGQVHLECICFILHGN